MSDYTPSLYASIEDAVFALAVSPKLPAAAVEFCAARYSESARLLRGALQRGANGEIVGDEEARLLFRSLFIIGNRRDPLGFKPLLRLLQRPDEEVEWLLGDATTDPYRVSWPGFSMATRTLCLRPSSIFSSTSSFACPCLVPRLFSPGMAASSATR